MSAPSVRRLKDRGGSIPTKPITPISDKPSFGTARKFSDKENPNPNPYPRSRVSGSTQRPAIKPMLPRISNAECESRPKSRPRGRSPSPSDFTKILSDLRRAKVTGEVGSAGKGLARSGRGFEKKGVRDLGNGRVADKGVNGFRVYSDEKEVGSAGKRVVGGDESDLGKVVSGGKYKKMDALPVNHVKSSMSDVQEETIISANVTDKKVVVDEESDGGKLVRGGKGRKVESLPVNHVKSSMNGVQDESFSDSVIDIKREFGSRNGVWKQSGLRSSSKCIKVDALPLNHVKSSMNDVKDESFSDSVADSKGEFGSRNGVMKQSGLRSASDLSVYGGCKEKGVNVNEGENVKNKHASRLQAKLAYLEGKVKKIASDIKKTKEILDMNNTDASKVMLSDIQDKISGIEEGMGKAIADFHTNFNLDGSSKSGDSERIEAGTVHQRTMRGVNHQTKQPEPAKLSAKGLSGEELEARLFPHHKLLRNRPSLKLPTLDNSRSPSDDDENPITIEFLASLNKDQSCVVQEVHEAGDAEASTTQQSTTSLPDNKENAEVDLEADERLDDFDDRENKPKVVVEEEMEDDSASQLMEIGRKTSTGGWFVSEGEAVLLAHDDGSCSFYDVANQEEKAEYMPPSGIPKNLWKDCWIIRAPSADGCSGKYVVAASAGNTMDSGFCSWDFYTKDVKAFHTEDNRPTSRVSLGSLRRNALAEIMPPDNNRQWWYRPCGPLMVSTASCQRSIKVFDIRDGEQVMKWDVQKPVLGMDYCSPLQWRNRGKVVVAETEGLSLWDVSSQSPEALLSVSTSGRRISALHVNNTDGELGGGVRQRVSSSEAEGNDGVFCTVDSINILDFRHPSGIGLKLPKIGVNVESVFSRGDSVFLGCNNITSGAKKDASSSQVLQFSLRKQGIISTYQLPESNAHSHHKAITQVWGNSSLVMATCGLGLFVFDAAKEEGGMPLPSFAVECGGPLKAKEVVGPNDLYLPSFDYHSSQVLLISRDRPAMWRHLL